MKANVRPAEGFVTLTSTCSTCLTSPFCARPATALASMTPPAVRVDGLTVVDVLSLSVRDALKRFADQAPIAAALRPVSEVGLDYLRLGEPTPSLSVGAARTAEASSQPELQRKSATRRAVLPGPGWMAIWTSRLGWPATGWGKHAE